MLRLTHIPCTEVATDSMALFKTGLTIVINRSMRAVHLHCSPAACLPMPLPPLRAI